MECRVIAVDPDTGGSDGGSGVAVVAHRKVLAVGLAHTKHANGMRAAALQRVELAALLRRACLSGQMDRGVVEVPMDFGQRRYADPNDLMRLSLISGCAATVLDEFCVMVEWVEPYKWKGQRTKVADHRNTLRYFDWEFTQKSGNHLPRFELPRGVILLSDPPTTEDHYSEICDAMGMGIYGLAREGAV